MSLVNQLLLPIHRASEKIVPKVWGFEGHIVNNDKFCLKYLVFYKGGKLSLHYHKIKTELFHCISGKFGLQVGGEMEGLHEKRIFTPGDKIYLTPKTRHSLECFEEGIIVEVSTTDRAEDSIRITNSSFDNNNGLNILQYMQNEK